MSRTISLTAVILVSVALTSTSPAAAQTRAPPEATQHALDELANAIAQGRITRTPTPSATPTPSPTITPKPTASSSTDTPTPAATTPVPTAPILVVSRTTPAYVRPIPGDPSETWLELALPQGRWAVQYDTALCTPPAPWTNVWLAMDEESDRPITVVRDDASAMCALALWSSASELACATDDHGDCDVEMDDGYASASGQVDSSATATPLPTPNRLPRLAPTPQPPVAPAALTASRERPVEVVVQTVVVVVTLVPTPTRIVPRTSIPIATPTPTRTATLAPSPTLEPTPTDTLLLAAAVAPSPTEFSPPIDHSAAPTADQTLWNWPLTLLVGAIALGAIAIWLVVARSGPLMW